MYEPFFITGLPRSRTAWWAVVTGAIHEPKIIPKPWGGVSDSGLGIFLPGMIHSFRPRTLIVERPKADVMASLKAYLRPVAMNWDNVSVQLDQLLTALSMESPLIKRVAFKDLNDLETVRECLDHLHVPEPRNLEQMLHMVVNSSLDYNLALLANMKVA